MDDASVMGGSFWGGADDLASGGLGIDDLFGDEASRHRWTREEVLSCLLRNETDLIQDLCEAAASGDRHAIRLATEQDKTWQASLRPALRPARALSSRALPPRRRTPSLSLRRAGPLTRRWSWSS